MKVLVTGGRGLLGSAVVRELVRRGHDVTSFQRSSASHAHPVREVLGDITDPDAVAAAMAGQDGVVHLAALVSMVGAWDDFVRVNVDGTRSVLDAASAAGVTRFVQISSPSVAHAGEPLVGASATPADPDHARGNYARSKAIAERDALSRDGDAIAVCAIRPHLVWGPGDTQLIGRIAERARAGRLMLVDDGAALIDTTYVDNAADAIAQAFERCDAPDVHGRAFVVSNGQPRTVFELVSRIAIAAGAAVERAWVRTGREGEPPLTAFVAEQLGTAHWFDQRATRKALDWRPRVSIEEGLAELARSFTAEADVARRGAPATWPSTAV